MGTIEYLYKTRNFKPQPKRLCGITTNNLLLYMKLFQKIGSFSDESYRKVNPKGHQKINIKDTTRNLCFYFFLKVREI